jgi:hypothetical protein
MGHIACATAGEPRLAASQVLALLMPRGRVAGVQIAAADREKLLAEALLGGLPCPVKGLCDLRPGSALRTGLLDRSALDLLQDLLHLGKRVEDLLLRVCACEG